MVALVPSIVPIKMVYPSSGGQRNRPRFICAGAYKAIRPGLQGNL